MLAAESVALCIYLQSLGVQHACLGYFELNGKGMADCLCSIKALDA